MKERVLIVAALILATAGLATAVVVAAVGGDDEVQRCPDGQELVRIRAGGLDLRNDKPPPAGSHYADRSGNVRVESDRDSASGNVPLEIRCRPKEEH
jgi:hypothetical protein